MFDFKFMFAMMVHVIPSKEWMMNLWTTVCLMSSLVMVVHAVKSVLLIKKSLKKARYVPGYTKAYSTYLSRLYEIYSQYNRSGNDISMDRGSKKKK